VNARIAAILMVLFAAVTLAACGDDDEGGETISGSGYEFTLPDGWQDAQEVADEVADDVREDIPIDPSGTYDSLVAGESEDDFTTNLNVVLQTDLPANMTSDRYTAATLQVFEDPRLSRRLLPQSLEIVTPPDDPTLVRLDGEDAFEVTLESESEGRQVGQRLVLLVREGNAYTITFSASADEFDAEVADLDEIVDSWRWTG
jgi:hypothetical protein